MNQPTRVEPTVTTDGGSTRTLDRAFALLEAVALAGTGVGVSELAVSSGLDKGTVSRLLGSLRGLGYVQQSETDRRYVLGGRCLWLARQYQGSQVARQIAHPRLEELADQTAETVHFALLEGVQMIYVDEIKHDGPIQLKSSIGNRLRVDLAATGRAVLSQLDTVELGRVLAAVEALVEPAQRDAYLSNLRLDLTGYQRAGWATVDRGDDITRIAAAVCDASGVPIGGVSVSGPTFRVHDRSMELAQLCTETAARISVDLGFRPAHQISQH